MYAVVFTAELKQLDENYLRTASLLRQLALEKYGCREFTAVTEGSKEIAVSLWDSEEQIRRWKQDTEHLRAQATGKAHWYSHYRVMVTKIEREYQQQSG